MKRKREKEEYTEMQRTKERLNDRGKFVNTNEEECKTRKK